MRARIPTLVLLVSFSLLDGRNAVALDRPVAQPPHGRDPVFDIAPPPATAAPPQTPPSQAPPAGSFSQPPPCPLAPAALTPPPWDGALAGRWFRVALEHRGNLVTEVQKSIDRFAAMPTAEEFAEVFGPDGEDARATSLALRHAAAQAEPGLMSVFALVYAAREQQTLAFGIQPSGPRYTDFAIEMRERTIVAIARDELSRLPSAAGWIDDPKLVCEHRTEIAPLVGRLGFAADEEIKTRPDLLACIAAARTSANVDYAGLRQQVEIVTRNAPLLDYFLRFAGIDLDATLKWYTRDRSERKAVVERVAEGVSFDRTNGVAYLESAPTTVAVHLDVTSRDPVPDFAVLVWDWEHGRLGDVSRAQMEALVQAARQAVEPGPFAEVLDATLLDLRTHYALGDTTADWTHPRVSRWERSLAGKNEQNTAYELQLDTRGSYAVPATETFATKRMISPVGTLLAVTLRMADLPKRAVDAFARNAPTLHVALLPDPGISFEVYAHARSLTRAPGVPPAALWSTPFNPPPASGWDIRPFGTENSTGHEDAVLVDVHPLPNVSPGEPRSFGFHVCLLTPFEATADGGTVRFTSPVWRNTRDIPTTARFVVFRRDAASHDEWTDIAGVPLSLRPGADYPYGRVSPISAQSRDGFVELSLKDLSARAGHTYEYRVVHRCALQPYPTAPPSDTSPAERVVSARPAS